MGLKSKIKTWFFLDDEYYEEEVNERVEQVPVNTTRSDAKKNIVSIQSIQKSTKLILFEPRMYAEAQDIADHLKNRRPVVVNLQRLDHEQARRIIDFLSGTVYAIGGDIQRIGTHIFLCTPDNVEVSGNISDFMTNKEQDNTRW